MWSLLICNESFHQFVIAVSFKVNQFDKLSFTGSNHVVVIVSFKVNGFVNLRLIVNIVIDQVIEINLHLNKYLFH